MHWFFLVEDRTFVHVPRLLAQVEALPTDRRARVRVRVRVRVRARVRVGLGPGPDCRILLQVRGRAGLLRARVLGSPGAEAEHGSAHALDGCVAWLGLGLGLGLG